MEFARKSLRGRLSLPIPMMIQTPNKPKSFGTVQDISATGMAVIVNQAISPQTQVDIFVDPNAFGALRAQLPVLRGAITWLARTRTSDGKLAYRAGVAFNALPIEVRSELSALATRLAQGTGSHSAVTALEQPIGPDLAMSAQGRERLYQVALGRLAARDYKGCREAAMWSLKVMPHARHLRVLLNRATAEEALEDGNIEMAKRETSFAKNIAPEDPDVLALAARIETHAKPATKSFIARIFGAQQR